MAATTQFLLDKINSSFEFVFRIESVFLSRNPQPATRNPQPATHNPQPATRIWFLRSTCLCRSFPVLFDGFLFLFE